jgi:D-amino acid aminotransferase
MPVGEARISLLHPMWQNGFGVYESLEVINGVPFHLDEHMARLAESARLIEMDLPFPADRIATWVTDLSSRVEEDHTVRVIALGMADDVAPQVARDHADERVVAVLAQALPRYPEHDYHRGVRVVTYEGCRHLPACKSLNTLVNYLARRHAVRAGVREAVLCSEGRLTEGSRSNVFAVRGGQLWTPPAGQVLSGITRDIVLRLAFEAGLVVRERSLYLAEVVDYEEFFITSTSMHVMPVVAVDDLTVGSGQVGSMTVDLMRLFETYHRRYFESPTPYGVRIAASGPAVQPIVAR